MAGSLIFNYLSCSSYYNIKHPLICLEMDSILATTSWDMDYTF